MSQGIEFFHDGSIELMYYKHFAAHFIKLVISCRCISNFNLGNQLCEGTAMSEITETSSGYGLGKKQFAAPANEAMEKAPPVDRSTKTSISYLRERTSLRRELLTTDHCSSMLLRNRWGCFILLEMFLISHLETGWTKAKYNAKRQKLE